MQVVCKELIRAWVKSKLAKIKYYSQKKSKRGRIEQKIHITRIQLRLNFFQWGWTMLELGYLVYKEMTRDGGKSNVAKRNLIGGI